MIGSGPRASVLALAGLAMLAGAATAQPFPSAPRDRREVVAGWRVVHVYDEDGGRDVGMSVTRDGVSIDYFVNYWRGNGRPFPRVEIKRAGESCGGEQWEVPHAGVSFPPEADVAGNGRRLRARLVTYLGQCDIGGAQADRLLRGFTPAFTRLAAFAEAARRYTNAVNCSIEHYPDGPDVVRRRCHRR